MCPSDYQLATKLHQHSNICQQNQELSSGLPLREYHGPMLLNYSFIMGTAVSNMALLLAMYYLFQNIVAIGYNVELVYLDDTKL